MRNEFLLPGNAVFGSYAPNQAFFGRLDRAIVASPNGDAGSTHAPKMPIGIGGQGVQLATAGSRIEGGVITERGGRCVLGNNDWPKVSPARPRSITMPLRRSGWRTSSEGTSSRPLGLVGGQPGGSTIGETFLCPVPSRLLHKASTLVSLVLTFRVGRPHAAVPTMPFLFFSPLDLSGVAAFTGIAQLAAPATGDLWFNNGDPQTLTLDGASFAPIPGGTIIDTAANTYVVKITDEDGVNSLPGNIFESVTINFSAINDLRFA